ncbi:tRNA methyltransferase 10 homolog C [Myxocyprinus asiaticus]|uniref:tRNA methyltransferase 10 homolog C n=1 Tax=Myxocyprinus asiaticus TaxID=70543 RepID=UPI002223AA1C|nr:tRNA methyltransferase 10 homolog C [Myxocyprinus asiaticus]XP_051561320.1 tRNA methyltransferase 10 homolog C [Myxocyprinus asiaticus]XP_051561322.1 tRNA methyltransferase 10 homolog C [Myxocyprinus asiaticus]XP_051561323.1 tRNA methyltransferase 10 homolog C [Myxocyprinus asiaticus]
MMFQRLCSLAVQWKSTSAPVQTVYKRHQGKLRLLDLIGRPISTSWRTRKDGAESIPAEKLDLDIWKSVMKSQAMHAERKGEENLTPNPETEPSLLEANRELVEMWHQAGKFVPKNITDEQLEVLSGLTTKSGKKKFLKYLAIKEGHKISKKEKQEKKKSERNLEADMESDRDEGDSLKNTFMLKFWSHSMDKLLNWRVAQAMRFGQPLVYDMSYEQHMSQREIENTVSQLLETEGWNRRSVDPFHLHFCNLQHNGAYFRELLKRYGTETWERMLITTTARRHVDVFPLESLVYLTADSPNVLHKFDHSKVYVVGAMVDRSIHSGISLANAKRLRLATARLPLDEYLDWDSGAKNLTLDQMIRILTTVKETGIWQKALEFVPKRKHSGFHQQRDNRTETKSRMLVDQEENWEKESKRRTQKSHDISQESAFPGEIHLPSRVQNALKIKSDGQRIGRDQRNWWEDK